MALGARRLFIVVATLFLARTALATERAIRWHNSGSGSLHVDTPLGATQDEDGYIWVGTAAGLVRFDGITMERKHADRISKEVWYLAPRKGGGIWALEYADEVFEITDGGIRALPQPWEHAGQLAVDDAGRPWVAADGQALLLIEGTWEPQLTDVLDEGERVGRVISAPGEMLVLTSRGVLRVNEQGVERVADVPHLWDAQPMPDGSMWLMVWYGPLRHVVDGRVEIGPMPPGRGADLALRGDALWVATDYLLAVLRPGAELDLMTAGVGIHGGGPLLVDAEGSMWMSTTRGLAQLPEPDTAVWHPVDGVANSGRWLTAGQDRIWVTSWGNASAIERDGEGWKANYWPEWSVRQEICDDKNGWGWVVGHRWIDGFGDAPRPNLLRFGRDGPEVLPWDGDLSYRCVTDRDGIVWMSTYDGLFRSDESSAGMLEAPRPFGYGRFVLGLGVDDTLWATAEALADAPARICQASLPDLRAGEAEWICEELPDVDHVAHFAVISGELWAASRGAGVLAHTDTGWKSLGLPPGFASNDVQALAPSQRGGAWVSGHGITARVEYDQDGWRVLETLSGWQGVATPSSGDVLEVDDGSVWLVTPSGATLVPQSARDASMPPPRVQISSITLDGVALVPGDRLDLPADTTDLELHFAALTFRDRAGLRYRVRTSASAPWVQTSAAVYRIVEPSAGDYEVEVQASLNGVSWSEEPAIAAFSVAQVWYLRWWALLGYALVLVGAATGAQRVSMMRKVAVERERLRISLDLHDELGSGLGSIGLLAGLVASGHLPLAEHERLTLRMGQSAEQLGGMLTDIIWSLRSGSAQPEALADYLADRGAALFAGQVEFKLHFPEQWPKVPLSLAVRRNVQLIAVEAMHNAAKHAQASRVDLSLEPGPRAWRLVVQDDGRGLDGGAPTRPGGGTGIEGMQRRAVRIGAVLDVHTPPEGGTVVAVEFDPAASGTS